MIIAKDIMAPAIISVTPESSLDDAMELLVENRISGIPVINEEGRLVGIISEADRIKIIGGPDHGPEATVEQCMTRGVVTVDEDATVEQIANLLMRVGIRRIPVMSHGSVVGIISRSDLVRALHNNPECEEECSTATGTAASS
jgi:CBS domain-containing protein